MGGCRTRVSCGDTIKLSGRRTRVSRGGTIKLLCHWGTKETKQMRKRAATRLCRTVAVVSVRKIRPQASNALSETKRARDMVLKLRLA